MKELHKQQCPACAAIMRPKVKRRQRKLMFKVVYVDVVYICTKCRHKWSVDDPVTKKGKMVDN